MKLKRVRQEERHTLADHVAIGFLNIVLAAPTGFLLWLALNGVPVDWAGWLPIEFIAWFTAGVVMVGVITQDVWLVNFYGWLWRNLLRWFSYGTWP